MADRADVSGKESAADTEVQDPDTLKVRDYWDKYAPKYDREMGLMDRVLFDGGREWACSMVQGRVLEVAVGTGRNLPFYPPGTDLTAIEFSPGMLEIARTQATKVIPTASLRLGDAQRLEFPDDSFDTVICTLALCTIPDDARAVAEMNRVLKPGGKLILMEHVRSPRPVVRAVQRALEVLTLRLQHDHLTREPLRHMRKAGFEVVELRRLKLGIVERLVARKPA